MTTAASSSTPNSHLSDPALAPFLSKDFSTAQYLNSVLPPLLPPTSLPAKRPANAEPLSTLSTQATTLLSTLDLHAQRLIATLQSLTDEILRISPRLGYEVDLLRSDVLALGEEIETSVVPCVNEVAAKEKKPEGLDRLQMLAKVRGQLEVVVKVFGDAMDWTLDAEAEESPQPRDEEAPIGAPVAQKQERKKGGNNPSDEVLYLMTIGELDSAQEKLDALKQLAKVFDSTVEGPARMAVVSALQEKIDAAKKSAEVKAEPVKEKTSVEKKPEKKDEEGGYYGLIEHLRGLRGM